MAVKHRSGRFTARGNFVVGRANVFYRVINSAEFDPASPDTNEIRIKYGPGGGDSVLLRPTFSIDVFINDRLDINGLGDVQGIYDVIPSEEVRNGRFRTRGTMSTADGVQILAGPSGQYRCVYRIFNSGDADFEVFAKRGGNSMQLGATIAPDQSLDFVTRPNMDVWVQSATGSDHIEGIYELLKDIN
ncbi:MAG: hypothetical protein Fues2KO_07880 [Fuerstiella sp.]